MDWQAAFNLLFTLFMVVVSGAGGWFGNTLWKMIQSLQSEISKAQIHLAANYSTKQELQQAMDRVFHKLERIEDIIKTKVDK